MSTRSCDVAVVGAGPYGLAAAAHLGNVGIGTRVFGEPMEFWQSQMPVGMLLRSSWDASHISDPLRRLTLDRFEKSRDQQLSRPLPLADFIDYGRWFQQQSVPDVDRRRVIQVERRGPRFRLSLDDEDATEATCVVVATGLRFFPYRPSQFAGLPPSLVSHASDHPDLAQFANRRVVVVGSGQSALESAALLTEGGADVEVVCRAPGIRWLRSGAWYRRYALARLVLYPPTDVGPPGLNQIVARPDLFRLLPLRLQRRVAYRSIRPAVSEWVYPRIRKITITSGRQIVSAVSSGSSILLTLNDGSEREADHVLLATGYRVDVPRHPLLAPDLASAVRCVGGYPVLTAGMESSVPGLHFLGAPAAASFGPLMRFVAGTDYSARALTRQISVHTFRRLAARFPSESWPVSARS